MFNRWKSIATFLALRRNTSLFLVALVLAGAAGLRLGALPFHAHAARLAESPLRGLVPLLCVLSPGLMALVVLGGTESSVQPLGLVFLTLIQGTPEVARHEHDPEAQAVRRREYIAA